MDSRLFWREGQAEKTGEVSDEAGPSLWPQGT